MPSISLMIKPASSACNLTCEYCFYHSLAVGRTSPSHGTMSAETYGEIIKKAFEYADGSLVMISFQGGEPLLCGKNFFRTAIELTKKLNLKNSEVSFGLQTNGTLIDEEWCRLFKDNGFLVGLSLDGDEQANALRKDANGTPAFKAALNAAELLKAHKVDFNILSVLTKQTATRIEEIYAFFKSNGFKHLQFIPCLKPLMLGGKGNVITNKSANGGSNKDSASQLCRNDCLIINDGLNSMKSVAFFSVEDKLPCGGNRLQAAREDIYLSAEDYKNFLFKCFDCYLKDFISNDYVSVRYFDNLVCLANLKQTEQCGMNGHCCRQFVIEADGEVYPCDFYCLDAYSLGNINNLNFFDLSNHPRAVKFIAESLSVEAKCRVCPYFGLCKNSCKRERIDIDKCEANKAFFKYALPHLKRMS